MTVQISGAGTITGLQSLSLPLTGILKGTGTDNNIVVATPGVDYMLPNGYANVKDFGAVGDGVADDTVAIQACIDYLQVAGRGGVVYLPPGRYKITSNLVFSWPNMTSGFILGRVVLRGAGAMLSVIDDYRTNVSTGGAVTFDFSSYTGTAIDGHYMFTWCGGFSVIKQVNYTVVAGGAYTTMGTGVGIYGNKIPTGAWKDITVKGYYTNMQFIDCLGTQFDSLYLTECNTGLEMGIAAFSEPNAVEINKVIVAACKAWGINAIDGCPVITNLTAQGCGFMGAVSGAVRYRNSYTPLPKGVSIYTSYFENNRGSADIYIETTTGTVVAIANIVASSLFSRTDATYYTTNNIALVNNGTCTMEFTCLDNGFRSYGTYVESAARKYVATSGATTGLNINYIGNVFFSAVADPTPIPGTALVVDTLSVGTSTVQVSSAGTNTVIGPVAVVPATGIAPITNNTFVNGAPSLRWAGMYTQELDVNADVIWNGYTIPAPTGDTTSFLRNDGTWALVEGAGTVSSIETGAGLTGGPITSTGTIALDFAASNTWTANQTFNGANIGTYSTVPSVTSTGTTVGLANSTNAVILNGASLQSPGDAVLDLGATALRWSNFYLKNDFVWNGYTIDAPVGDFTFLRNDGTWVAAPGTGTVTSITAGSGLSGGVIDTVGTIALDFASANTWTANQTFNGASIGTYSTVPSVTSTGTTVGLANSTNAVILNGASFQTPGDNVADLGATALRWSNFYLKNNFVWNGYTIPAPAGSSLFFLRNDGTWAVPDGSGSVSSIETGAGLTGGPITTTGTIALDFAASNAWTANQNFNGANIGTFLTVPSVTSTGTTVGLANSTNAVILNGASFQTPGDNVADLGDASVRWRNLYLKNNFVWNGYTLPAPTGNTTYFLRNDGTWAVPADSSSLLSTPNVWTANQNINGASIGTYATVPSVVSTGATVGLANSTNAVILNGASFQTPGDNVADLGDTAIRWRNLHLKNNIVWNGYTLPAPTGNTTYFLRNDGTWAVPADSSSLLSTPNVWTANQNINGASIGTYSTVPSVVSTGSTVGLANSTNSVILNGASFQSPGDNLVDLGTAALRWKNFYLRNSFVWNGYTIPAPTGGVTFLRNDGTWAAPTGTVSNIATGAGLTGGPITSTGTIALNLAASNTWTANQTFNGASIGTYSTIPSVVTTGTIVGLANSTNSVILNGASFQSPGDNVVDLGTAALRWKNFYLKNNFAWNGYTIPAPTGGTTSFLRNDGTWATPAGAGTVTNIATGAGLTGGPITSTGTIALNLAASNTWTANQTFNGASIGTYSTVPSVTSTGTTVGLANSTNAVMLNGASFQSPGDNLVDLGTAALRWKNLYLKNSFAWNGYTIPAPAGSSTAFLRNDGTWAVPAGSGISLSTANTWTATQTFPAAGGIAVTGSTVTIGSSGTNMVIGPLAVVPATGIGPTVTASYVCGSPSLRWSSVNSVDASFTGVMTVTDYTETVFAPAAGSAFTVSTANGTVQKFTTNANTTITLPASAVGKSYTVIVAYGGVHTLTWAGGGVLKWAGGTAPIATSVNGKFDIFVFTSDGTNTYGRSGGSNF